MSTTTPEPMKAETAHAARSLAGAEPREAVVEESRKLPETTAEAMVERHIGTDVDEMKTPL